MFRNQRRELAASVGGLFKFLPNWSVLTICRMPDMQGLLHRRIWLFRGRLQPLEASAGISKRHHTYMA